MEHSRPNLFRTAAADVSLLPQAQAQTQSQPHSPGWIVVIGLVLIIICIGFFITFLLFKLNKQEKQLEAIQRQMLSIPSPDDISQLIHKHYYSPEIQQPIVRNVCAMVETRLNDFDEYCKTKYGKNNTVTGSTSAPTSAVHASPSAPTPAVHASPSAVHASPGSDSSNSVVTTSHPQFQSQSQPQPQPDSVLSPALIVDSTIPPPLEDSDISCDSKQNNDQSDNNNNIGGQQHIYDPLPSSSQTQNQPRSRHVLPSPPSRTILSEALPVLLSMFSGNNNSGGGNGGSSNNNSDGGASIPVLLGDIMGVIANQQARQTRQPSSM